MSERRDVYAKRLNGAQRRVLQRYADMTGWEPVGQDDYDAGVLTFKELWRLNISLLESTVADVTNINTRGTGA